MQLRLILPSSEVSRLWSTGPHWHLVLSAATVQAHVIDEPRLKTWGHLNGVTLTFRDALVEGDLDQALGTLSDCDLHLDGKPIKGLEMPCELKGRIACTLTFHHGGVVSVSAGSLSTPRGELDRFRESMAC